jgi:hypothetical protein
MVSKHQGSRGHLLDLLDDQNWPQRLNSLIVDTGALVNENSKHTPINSGNDAEWELQKFCREYCSTQIDLERFENWWVKNVRSPTWDLIATCQLKGKPGLLIVEAKAHENEIHRDGKPLPSLETPDKTLLPSSGIAKSLINHGYIGRCIHEARDGLRHYIPKIAIDRDKNYQLSNRIACSWMLAECGMPNVLLYLGFTEDEGMSSEGTPLRSAEHWETLVRDHLDDVGATTLPDTDIRLPNGSTMKFCIGSLPVTRQSVLKRRSRPNHQ